MIKRKPRIPINKKLKPPLVSLFQKAKARLLENVRKLRNPNEYSFIAMGDSWAGDGQTSNIIFASALSAIRSLQRKPLFILHSGDAVFTGTDKEFKTGGTYTDAEGDAAAALYLFI